MASFSHEVTIGCSTTRVWEVFTDFDHWPEWTSSVLRAQRLGTDAPGVGLRVRIEQPKLMPAVWTMTEWSPGRSFTWVSRSPGVRITAVHSLEEVAGGCRVTQTLRFGGPLGGLVGLLMGSLTKHYLQIEGAGLKQRCEAAGGPDSSSPELVA